MSIPQHLDSKAAHAAASMFAEGQAGGLSNEAMAAAIGWPVWLVALLADLIINPEGEED